jgi:hypothetical protein
VRQLLPELQPALVSALDDDAQPTRLNTVLLLQPLLAAVAGRLPGTPPPSRLACV